MLNSVLQVGIGMALVFLVFSLLVSGMHEFVARLFSWRSKSLWAAIRQLVDGNGVPAATPRSAAAATSLPARARQATGAALRAARHAAPTGADPRPRVDTPVATPRSPGGMAGNLAVALYAHPLIGEIDKLHTRNRSRIERLPRDQFAAALIDVLVPDGNGETSVTRVRDALRAFPDHSPLKRPLLLFVSEAGDSLDRLRTDVAAWFDGQMVRLNRRYRRRAKWWMLAFGLMVAVGFNVDALNAAERLYKDDALQAAVVAEARSVTTECKDKQGAALTTCVRGRADKAVTLPVGWKEARGRNPFLRALGWILSAFALMQGGPFWFNLLSREVAWKGGGAQGSTTPTS